MVTSQLTVTFHSGIADVRVQRRPNLDRSGPVLGADGGFKGSDMGLVHRGKSVLGHRSRASGAIAETDLSGQHCGAKIESLPE